MLRRIPPGEAAEAARRLDAHTARKKAWLEEKFVAREPEAPAAAPADANETGAVQSSPTASATAPATAKAA